MHGIFSWGQMLAGCLAQKTETATAQAPACANHAARYESCSDNYAYQRVSSKVQATTSMTRGVLVTRLVPQHHAIPQDSFCSFWAGLVV